MSPSDQKLISKAAQDIITAIGEDPKRKGLLSTPRRVAQAYEFLTSGYQGDLKSIINNAIFEEDVEDMVIVQDIELYSLCEHHLLPFFGKAHVAYLPNKKIIGISKIPRIVELYSRRLQVQERLTQEIANAIKISINPKGVAVVLEAKHLCMMMRGVEKQNSRLVTSTMLGAFRNSQPTRIEFLELLKTNRI